MSPSATRVLRCFLVWLGATALLSIGVSMLAGGVAPALEDVHAGNLADESFDTLLVWLCSFLAAACGVWFWVTTTIVILQAASGLAADHRPQRRGCPEFVRRAVLIACGVAVAGSMSVPAHAAAPRGDPSHIGHTLAGLPLPERAVRQDSHAIRMPQAHLTPIARADADRHAGGSQVRVRPGDSLWSIAARTLGPTAATAEVNQRWHEIYELNQALIGADPNVIHPGQELRLDEA